jgi:hypothetical protein
MEAIPFPETSASNFQTAWCSIPEDNNLLNLCHVNLKSYVSILATFNTECSKSHETFGLRGICVSWTRHFKEIVASMIPVLKPSRLLFMGASQGYCVFKSSTHTARATGQHSAHCGQDINWHIAKRVH